MNSMLKSIKYIANNGRKLQYNGQILVSTGIYKNKTHVFKMNSICKLPDPSKSPPIAIRLKFQQDFS